MLVKLGVDVSRLNRPMRRALNTIQKVFEQHGYEPIVTSTYEGNHSPSSLHYCNDAVDVRLPTKETDIIVSLGLALKRELGQAYDAITEGNHFHIEYDPN